MPAEIVYLSELKRRGLIKGLGKMNREESRRYGAYCIMWVGRHRRVAVCVSHVLKSSLTKSRIFVTPGSLQDGVILARWRADT